MKMHTDPAKLLFISDMTPEDVDGFDLSLVQELKRGKDGAVEVKLADKTKMAEIYGKKGGNEALDKLVEALSEAAKVFHA